MGQFGLWDPWEMNRANIARQMTDAQKVLVVEDTSDGHPLGPIGSWLALRYGDHLQITSLDLGDARHARSARKLLDTAARKLDQGIHHLLIVNLKTVVKDPQDRSQVEQLATWFDGVATKNPGMAKLFAAPLPKRDDKKDTVVGAIHRHLQEDLVGSSDTAFGQRTGWDQLGQAGSLSEGTHTNPQESGSAYADQGLYGG